MEKLCRCNRANEQIKIEMHKTQINNVRNAGFSNRNILPNYHKFLRFSLTKYPSATRDMNLCHHVAMPLCVILNYATNFLRSCNRMKVVHKRI